jgi:aldehyde dehydrogenase (NAD+)
VTTYKNFINGEWVAAQSGRTYQNVNPADTRETVAEYPLSDKADAVAAIDAAKRAFPGWGATTAVARGRILGKASQLIEARKGELAQLLTREEGKTLAEGTGECNARRIFFASSAD